MKKNKSISIVHSARTFFMQKLSLSSFCGVCLFLLACTNSSDNKSNDHSFKKATSFSYSWIDKGQYHTKYRTLTIDHVYYDAENRLKSFNVIEEESTNQYKKSTLVEIFYSSKIAKLSSGGNLYQTLQLEMNNKGYLASVSFNNTTINFDYNGDFLNAIKMVDNFLDGYALNYDITYNWKDGVIDNMIWEYDITHIKDGLSVGGSESNKKIVASLFYTNKINKNFIFPLYMYADRNEYDELKLWKIVNVLGQTGMLGKCPTLLPEETSRGEHYYYEFDKDGNIVEYGFSPANSADVETAVINY